MRHQVEKGTFSYENKERTKREKLVRTKWAFHRFGALTVNHPLQTVIYAGRSNAKPIEVGKNASNTI